MFLRWYHEWYQISVESYTDHTRDWWFWASKKNYKTKQKTVVISLTLSYQICTGGLSRFLSTIAFHLPITRT